MKKINLTGSLFALVRVESYAPKYELFVMYKALIEELELIFVS